MVIDIIQKNKEMYEANFEIISYNNIVGTINVKGKIGTWKISLKGIYNNIPFEFKYKKLGFKEGLKKFRSYQIFVSGNSVGEVYQTDNIEGIKYSYNELIYNGDCYKEYGISFGDVAKNPIYLNDMQVAQIEKEAIIYNDLHNYKIYIKNKDYALVSIIFACHMYINASFKPGIKVTKSVVKYYDKTTNKELLSKYDPNWVNELEENIM